MFKSPIFQGGNDALTVFFSRLFLFTAEQDSAVPSAAAFVVPYCVSSKHLKQAELWVQTLQAESYSVTASLRWSNKSLLTSSKASCNSLYWSSLEIQVLKNPEASSQRGWQD